ncbi:hypothetical protein ACVBIO_16460 [Shewanella sp. 0m-8]
MPTNKPSFTPFGYRLSALFSTAVLSCALLTCTLAFSPASYAKQACSIDALEAMENDSGYFQGLTAAVCKQLPHQEQFTMGAYLQWTDGSFVGERRYTLRTVIMDTQTHEIIARHTASLSERPGLTIVANPQTDNATENANGTHSADKKEQSTPALWIDTANYKLNNDTRALGVRMMAQQRPEGSAQYEADYLSLFIHQGHFLIPVVNNLPLYYWKMWQGDPKAEDMTNFIIESGKGALHIEPKQNKGFADLKLIVKTKLSGALPQATDTTQSRTIMTRLRFDGERYYIIDSEFGDARDWQSTEQWWKRW